MRLENSVQCGRIIVIIDCKGNRSVINAVEIGALRCWQDLPSYALPFLVSLAGRHFRYLRLECMYILRGLGLSGV